MTHVTLRTEFEDLIDPYAPVGQVGTGFDFTEGPIWHPLDHFLLFSDMPGDVRRRWDARRGVVEVKRPSNKCNGMTYDADLNLIVCEHATSSLIRERPDGRREVLASHFDNQELNSPNDVCVHSSGAIYFSDPWYGRMPVYGVERPRQLGFQGVYRVPPGGGAPKLLVDRYLFEQPNGLCFSPDERILYVNDTVQASIRAFDVTPDGSLANPRVFASGIRSELEPGVPDGMKCDQRGNVWVTAPGGVWVYSPDGGLLGKVRLPELVANLAWGGADFRTLYLTATHSVYAIPTKVGPRHEPYMSGRRGNASPASSTSAPNLNAAEMRIDPQRCAMIIQDMQNDVIMDGGAFAESGAPAHARAQHVVENVRRVAEAARARGVAIIHVWFIVEPGAPGVTLNAPLFEGLVDSKALVRGSWGAAPASGLEPRPGDFVVEKMRMSAWEGTRLETILKATGRDMIINTGAWTNMSVEHTARTGADKGYFMIVPEDCCSTMNADWHNAAINFALQNVSVVTNADTVIKALG
ncbi:isochorismatase family protein [Bradyrhizobium jicamae]|uniref:Isochorismatase family protein n=1 Tax=Bradyrhizobium jicamae TaxID=280332 RepID=A0ABS5FHU3_9BRAD|nr:isochorismatase family protein [Bradyrhizobium jicamae]MBR0796358.1 isochorismatase family protein [Bradyrhizobium jicamae]MBR0932424.1 isochorismatase family protein [Bradyrhizobium jicamae]